MLQRQICPILMKDKEGMRSYGSGFSLCFQGTLNLYNTFLDFGKQVFAELPTVFASALT